MFNGIVFNTGKIKILKKKKKSILLGIETKLTISKKDIGSSICCNGVCLTLTNISRGILFFYISSETLKKSNFYYLKINSLVNLEKSLTHGQKISGHIQGHVDTTTV